jgi:peptidoglycan/xylan/chitin deacetylase (PgdA/CDA1 family)
VTLRGVPAARIFLWVMSLGGLALAARQILVAPVPLPVAMAALVGYAGFVTLGVLLPQLEMFGDVLWRGDPGSKTVALTFDDGPHPETTLRVLEALRAAGVTATFFVIGEKVERHPDVVRAIAEAGHELGSHGFRHARLYSLLPPERVKADILRSLDVIERASGQRPRWFRPPIGHVSPRVAAGAERAGVEIAAWSVRGLDGLPFSRPERVLARLVAGLRAGAILQLHDAAERDGYVPASLEILPRLLQAVAERGLRVVSLGDIAAAGDAD